MYYRTYFDKDNTIIKDSTVNLGANPLGTLFFGGDYSNPNWSRYIFHFPTDHLKTMYGQCLLGDLSLVRHKLVFKPTRFFGSIDKNNPPCLSTAYELCLFPINQDWSEGCGYDFDCVDDCRGWVSPNCNNSTGGSNWYFAKDGIRWDVDGIYDAYYTTGETIITGTTISGNTVIVTGETIITGSTPYLICQSYECSDCLLEYDITEYVNEFITGNTPNYGFGLAFHRDYEINPTGDYKYLGVYSKETRNFFKPYLETEYLNPINDDRHKFYMDKDNRLYLNVFLGGEPANLDDNPIVDIYDEQDRLYTTITGECVSLGVYMINIHIPTTGTTDCVVWRDVWRNLRINGRNRPDVEMEFQLLDSFDYYNIGNSRFSPRKFAFKVNGIKSNENIRRGDIRKVFVDAFEQFNINKRIPLDNIFYRLYVKEGEEQLDVIKWTPINLSACENYIYLDTTWMLPQHYYIDFKVLSNREETIYAQQIKFQILDDKIVC